MYKDLIAAEWLGQNFGPNVNPFDASVVVGGFARGSAENTCASIAAAKVALLTGLILEFLSTIQPPGRPATTFSRKEKS